jgi:hypothetical protein
LCFILWFPITKPRPKEKFAVLGPIEPKLMLLFIDTDVNPFVNNTQERRDHHLVIDAQSHPFLAYDSWVDCSYPIGYDLPQLSSTLQRKPEAVRGTISDDLRIAICQRISTSRLRPASKATKFVAALTDRTPFEF